MEKKIDDYLPFYVGRELVTASGFRHKLTHKMLAEAEEFQIPWFGLKLLLRPLSSMTEEEANELDVDYGNAFSSSLSNAIKDGGYYSMNVHKTFEITQWLLSRGFDLYKLIENGLAIDSTKQP